MHRHEECRQRRSSSFDERVSASADAFLAADAGTFSALSSEKVGVAGACVAPAQVAVQLTGLHGVVG
jgi:hypothetical protein